MKPEEFVQLIRKEASEDTTRNYMAAINRDDESENPSWELFKKIHSELSDEKRSMLWDFVRMVQSDCVSSVLSILDNQTYPAIQKVDLKLTHGDEIINGDLCDIYWEKEEEGWS